MFECTEQPSELSITTFWTFWRELSTMLPHCRWAPVNTENSNGGFGMSGCRFEVPAPVFPWPHPQPTQVGHPRSDSSSPWPSVQACRQQSAGITVLLPICLRPDLACRLPGRFKFHRYPVSGLEIHLIRRLPTERQVRQTRIVFLHVERHKVLDGPDRVECVQKQPRVFARHGINDATADCGGRDNSRLPPAELRSDRVKEMLTRSGDDA